MQPTEFYVVGETEEGSKFRPGDWADRISGLYGVVDRGAIRYTEEVCPAQLQGQVSVRVKSDNYKVRQDIILFALENNLRLVAKDFDQPLTH